MLEWLDGECGAAMARVNASICYRLGLPFDEPPPIKVIAVAKPVRRKRRVVSAPYEGGDNFFSPLSDPDKIEALALRGIRAIEFALSHRLGIAGSFITAGDLMAIKLAAPVAIDDYISGDDGARLNVDRIDLRSGLPRCAIACISTRGSKHTTSDMCINKIDAIEQLPGGYMPTGPGVAYAVNGVWEYPKSDQMGTYETYVTIDERGRIYPVSQYTSYRYPIGRSGTVRRQGWQTERPDEHGHVSSVFRAATTINCWKASHCYWTARIWRGDVSVRVSIPSFAVGRIFRDRERRSTSVQHWVRSHRRSTGSGVKMHLRGATDFKWRGLLVSIQMPGSYAQNLARSISMHDSAREVQPTPALATGSKLLHTLFANTGMALMSGRELTQHIRSLAMAPVDMSAIEVVPDNAPARKQRYYNVRDAVDRAA